MYSSKENVNILTALLVAHDIRHAVVCPGSRNAPIVHNLNECPDIQCYPVTDERSAGFYALGMAQATNEPVVVCVTSGSALLNVLPAVAEAQYQHHSLVVISADRPPQWIDQLDGQTLPQPDALGRFVKKAVSLPEPRNDEERWYCNRLVNEALLETRHHGMGPVHINVPISEPLFDFAVPCLPEERRIERLVAKDYTEIQKSIEERIRHAKRPLLIVGQLKYGLMEDEPIGEHLFVLSESMAAIHNNNSLCIDELFSRMSHDDFCQPDFVLYVGGHVVSKPLKRYLREAVGTEIWMATDDGQVHDVFCHVQKVIECPIDDINEILPWNAKGNEGYYNQMLDWVRRIVDAKKAYQPAYSQMATVKYLEHEIGWNLKNGDYYFGHIHFANSTAIRLANVYACHFVYCNRGVNGIEGSLSTAAGFSCATDDKVLCVIGDLSFFYDQNALWSQNLRGNLRILLLNNGKGGIFNILRGLEQSPARDRLVAAEHRTSAEGICMQNQVKYQAARDMASMQEGVEWLLQTESEHPLLLEVLTDADEDERAFKEYYRMF